MSGQPPSWSDLESRESAVPRTASEFDILCANVFGSGSGAQLLAELRRKHIDRQMNPLADERALRVLAAEQHLVRELELACVRGLTAPKKDK